MHFFPGYKNKTQLNTASLPLEYLESNGFNSIYCGLLLLNRVNFMHLTLTWIETRTCISQQV